MKGIRCSECGLMNLESDARCRRCGRGTDPFTFRPSKTRSPRDDAKNASWLYTLLVITLIGGGMYYIYTDFLKSFEQGQGAEVNRVNSPANQQAGPFRSNSDTQQNRVPPFKDALKNSPGLTAANRHTAETQKLMEQTK
jgi:hypothetical protein